MIPLNKKIKTLISVLNGGTFDKLLIFCIFFEICENRCQHFTNFVLVKSEELFTLCSKKNFDRTKKKKLNKKNRRLKFWQTKFFTHFLTALEEKLMLKTKNSPNFGYMVDFEVLDHTYLWHWFQINFNYLNFFIVKFIQKFCLIFGKNRRQSYKNFTSF